MRPDMDREAFERVAEEEAEAQEWYAFWCGLFAGALATLVLVVLLRP